MPSRINIGPEDGPYVAINESSGNLQLEDNSGNVVAEWDDGKSQWDFVENDISGVGAFDSESVSTEEADTRGPYQDKLSERSKDTWFQADEGVREVVVTWAFDSTNRTQVAASVNDEQTGNRIKSSIEDTPDPEDEFSMSFTVPDGSYYRIEESGDTVTLERWHETTRND